MHVTPVRGRALTWIAVGFLGLDGVLLVLAGIWGSQSSLAISGGFFLVAAAGVLFLWRRQQRALRELREARHALAHEARAIRDLLRKSNH